MAPHRPRKSTPTELTTDEEDMIMYDVQAEELEPNPEDKFAVMECFVNNPSEYMRALTPTRFRNNSRLNKAFRFVEWAQNEVAVVPDFHKRILFSDEAHFWLNGYVNKQNCRIWSEANPQVYVETPLHPEN
ncbi:hypothetical protein TNCV_3208001 [Trichonephila clavipes]|nr:hypothetical protein TNCV_3208001 [Trichonephila clavipes]